MIRWTFTNGETTIDHEGTEGLLTLFQDLCHPEGFFLLADGGGPTVALRIQTPFWCLDLEATTYLDVETQEPSWNLHGQVYNLREGIYVRIGWSPTPDFPRIVEALRTVITLSSWSFREDPDLVQVLDLLGGEQ